MDRGARWATVGGVAKSRTRLSDLTMGVEDPGYQISLLWTGRLNGGNHKTIRQKEVAREEDRDEGGESASKEAHAFYSRLAAISNIQTLKEKLVKTAVQITNQKDTYNPEKYINYK